MSRKPYELGLAFSGGGSRAAAFHRGTLRGLFEVGLLDKKSIADDKVVVSTVSGGSVFGAAWVASIADNIETDEFLNLMKENLSKGFIGGAYKFMKKLIRAGVKLGYTRTDELANTFDKAFFKKKCLKDLPDKPKICINSTVLNNGQMGKFSKNGFSVAGIRTDAVKDFPLCLAVAASAAYPVFLPPLQLKRGKKKHLPPDWGKGTALESHQSIALTDGGVLENLGTQTLLMGHTFPAWNIVLSDAGAVLPEWKPGNFIERLKGFAMGIFSASVSARVATVMSDKQDRHMRFQLFKEMEKTWFIDGLRNNAVGSTDALKELVKQHPNQTRRKVLYLRVAQSWERFLSNISEWRLMELMELYQERTGQASPEIPPRPHYSNYEALKKYPRLIEDYLNQILDDSQSLFFHKAKDVWSNMNGVGDAPDLNDISTSFTALPAKQIDALHDHAFWQVLISYALFW